MRKNVFENETDKKVLMKHNLLVKAKYSLNLVQNRIFEVLLYYFQKEKEGILSCEISREQFKNCIGKEKDKTIKGISDILESLRKKEILIAEKIEGKDKYKWHRYGLINGSTYNEETDTYTVKATEEIYILIQNYYDKREGHTPINLIVKLGLNNYYAQRIYDFIRSWSGTKKVINYKIEDLKDLMQLKEKYPLYADFKKRVLTPAIKELNNTGYFEIEIKENKVGRKVDSIDFIVKDLDKRVYFETKENKKIIELKSEEIASTDTNDFNSKNKNKIDEFYIPNKKLFTTKTLSNFENNFKEYNFKDSTYKKLLQESILITLDKDDEEKIKVKSYNYFKKTLQNKLNDLNKKENEHEIKKTKFHNFDETFTKYSEDELDMIIENSQRKKFG